MIKKFFTSRKLCISPDIDLSNVTVVRHVIEKFYILLRQSIFDRTLHHSFPGLEKWQVANDKGFHSERGVRLFAIGLTDKSAKVFDPWANRLVRQTRLDCCTVDKLDSAEYHRSGSRSGRSSVNISYHRRPPVCPSPANSRCRFPTRLPKRENFPLAQ